MFAGRDLARLPAHRIARAGIARTYQIPRPFAHLSVRDNVALAALFGHAALDRRAADAAALRWLAFTGLEARADRLPAELNLHQTKFLELARAFASSPRLVMLDEVLSGLSPAEIDEAVALVLRIRAQGTTIVLVEHVMRVVNELSDRDRRAGPGQGARGRQGGGRDGARRCRCRLSRRTACLTCATSASATAPRRRCGACR